MADVNLSELHAELLQATGRLQSIQERLQHARDQTLPRVGRNDDGALIVAGYLETYYTALETCFVRISQFFENSLSSDRWHSELLEKMNLVIDGVRERAVSDANLPRLRELLRSRHFRRYYVEMDYDWIRLDYLLSVFDAAHPAVIADLARFEAFVTLLRERSER